MCGVITIATLSSYLKGETTTSPVPSTIPISPHEECLVLQFHPFHLSV